MKDLNPREEHSSNLFDLSQSNFLLNTSLKARQTKANMNYWDFIKVKSFCTAKEIINNTNRQPIKWEKIFANDISDKEYPKYIKNLYNSTPQKLIIQVKYRQKT